MKYETSKEINNMLLLIMGSDDWAVKGRAKELNKYLSDNFTVTMPIEQFREGYATLWDGMVEIYKNDIELYKTINDVFSGRA